MRLIDAQLGRQYRVVNIESNDEELNSFLFTLGCYEGESVTVVSHISSSYVVAIKDGRYNIDQQLAEAIIVEDTI